MLETKSNPPRKTFSHYLAAMIFRLAGWKVVGELPPYKKFVIVGAPHTTNWDFVIMLLLGAYFNIRLRWAGKDNLFRPAPLGWLMRSLGGIPVNRRVRTRLVDQIIAAFQQHEEMVLVITPEGTRSKTTGWKTGFYYIALGAGVPIVLAFPDYPSKTTGIGPAFMPTGDIDADFEILRNFFSDKTGKYPEQQGEIRIARRKPDGPTKTNVEHHASSS